MKESKGIGESSQMRVDWFLKEEWDYTPFITAPNIRQQIKCKKKILKRWALKQDIDLLNPSEFGTWGLMSVTDVSHMAGT